MPKHKSKTEKGRRDSKKTPAMIVSRVLIGAGLVLILLALGYEAANYPWQTLFKPDEELDRIVPPDPAPPVYNHNAVTFEPMEGPTAEPVMPGDETLANFGDSPDRNMVQGVLGYIKIPKLAISVNIMNGYGAEQLLLGAGHVTGTPMPDEEGNVCIAGHRVTAAMHPFRHLDLMKPGNHVLIDYRDHVYTYQTLEVFTVENTETWIMQPVEGEKHLLTLIACHPPGSARQRIVLRARLILVDSEPVV